VGVLAGVVVPEVSLSALEVVVGALPVRTLAVVAGGGPSAWWVSVMAWSKR
jgi:hypothetical protein